MKEKRNSKQKTGIILRVDTVNISRIDFNRVRVISTIVHCFVGRKYPNRERVVKIEENTLAKMI